MAEAAPQTEGNEARRRAMLQAAAELISERGFGETRIADVLRLRDPLPPVVETPEALAEVEGRRASAATSARCSSSWGCCRPWW
mgnify:CR=1 FL=1